MTELPVRRLHIDLATPFARHWCGGDAFRSAFFNALSMSFPTGEQFFIDTVRAAHKTLPAAQQARLQAEVQGFVGQEATHRRIHGLFNAQLAQQGLVNDWEVRNLKNQATFAGTDLRHALAITAAHEHFTAIFAEWLLTYPAWFDGSEERLATMWLWHCAEESEHRATAFDLYQALGGNHDWRVTWMQRVSLSFGRDLQRQTIANLKRDGTLWQLRTWTSAARFLFGKRGLLRFGLRQWRNYSRADFHPSQQESQRSSVWLKAHAQQYSVVGG